MGVDRTDYLMLGVDVGYDTADWDKFEAEINGHPGARFDVVYDGMCGKYCIAGKIIARNDPYDGFEMTEIQPDDLGINRYDLAAKLSDAFGKTIDGQDIALLLFSHFS